ncbi:MAG: hypothetical protein KBT47_01535 [Armatimonadetes bacterium]|nr:hypothetical protein [Candidatus Hippobium faecium]
MNFDEAVDFLSSLAVFGIRPGTERTRYAAGLLGNPQKKYKTVHVAGTNGKGSTTTFISYILREAGYNVGTYTSPCVFKVDERIQFNLENISDEDFAFVFEKIKRVNEELKKTEYGSLTEFEAKTLGAFIYFAEKNVDYAVIEVGMGGRFDATNIIEPEVSLITSISLDHTEYLGDTIEKIAFEKAGIIKPNTPIISGADEKANAVIGKTAEENHAPFISDFKIKDKGRSYDLEFSLPGSLTDIKEKMAGAGLEITGSVDYNINNLRPGLFGKYQFSNSAISVICA